MTAHSRPYPYRTALITGASSGIGAHTARLLARQGTALVLVARRAQALERLADELCARHTVAVEVLPADLADPQQLNVVEDRLRTGQPAVELLVNNAGVGSTGMFSDLAADGELHKITLNVVATTRLTIAVLPRMHAAGHGGVLNVSSLAGWVPSPRNATYGATKAFITSLSESLNREYRHSGVHVTALVPGLTRTEFFAKGRVRVGPIPGQLWLDPERVALNGLKAVAAGRAVCVPSLHYALAVTAITRMPRWLRNAIGDRLWRTGITVRRYPASTE